MARKKMTNELLGRLNGSEQNNFPKYTTQIMNLANQNGQGTRPSVVGQLSEIFPEYLAQTNNPTIEDWEKWYKEKYPNAIKNATEKVAQQVKNLETALPLIDNKLVERWLSDLLIDKTYNGMYYQKAIISFIAEEQHKVWRLSTPAEEAQGIDGYIDNIPVSIKPDTYEHMKRLNEKIEVKIIIYSKTKDGIWIEY